MVVFNKENLNKLNENKLSGELVENYKNIALTTENEEEMLELIKFSNPFINREIAKNTNITIKVMNELLDNHSAYTMDIYIAKNKNITDEIKAKLYDISENQYKDSLMKKELDNYFNENKHLVPNITSNSENSLNITYSFK